MINLDRYNDACEIILTRTIVIWKRFAQDTKNTNEQKKYFSRALDILEQLTEILAERWRLIRKITPQNDVKKKERFFIYSEAQLVFPLDIFFVFITILFYLLTYYI
jgi:hypothetical protein